MELQALEKIWNQHTEKLMSISLRSVWTVFQMVWSALKLYVMIQMY